MYISCGKGTTMKNIGSRTLAWQIEHIYFDLHKLQKPIQTLTGRHLNREKAELDIFHINFL